MKGNKVSRSITPFSLFDPWNSPLCTCPLKYSLNPYTGCSFKCLYCYAVSYIGLMDSTPKKDYRQKLMKALGKLDKKLPINIGTSSDPYPPVEKDYKLTRFSLFLLGSHGFRVLITTKAGNLLVRDIDILEKINVAVTPTITTLDESLASKLEPYAPSPSERINSIEKLVEHGIPVGIRFDPIIPGLNDDEHSIKQVIDTLSAVGVKFIVTSTYKARPIDFRRMINVFPEYESYWRKLYFEEGERMHGYWYLSFDRRKNMLSKVVEIARKKGLEYATCREGLVSREFFTARSCDGTHLIPQRIKSGIDKLLVGDYENEFA